LKKALINRSPFDPVFRAVGTAAGNFANGSFVFFPSIAGGCAEFVQIYGTNVDVAGGHTL
jgi:hypothetical protein